MRGRLMWRHSFGKHYPETTAEDRDSGAEELASTVLNTAIFGAFLEVRVPVKCQGLVLCEWTCRTSLIGEHCMCAFTKLSSGYTSSETYGTLPENRLQGWCCTLLKECQ